MAIIYDLSILIPARNEMFLSKTIENILENIEGNTEVIAVMDGYWAEPNIKQNERVTILHNPVSIGQRAATNQAAKISTSRYLMKCDAHCAFDKGFDVKMMQDMNDNWTVAPLMRNLHAFDWVCPDGHRRYQGPSGPCKENLADGRQCGKETKMDILWKPKDSPKSYSYSFDSTPHFQYFREFSKRPEGQGEITETMSLQGSCFMLTRQKYWELGVCDENFGSWGSQGIEVAAKTWLSGGRVMVNKKTWYAHMFRTQGGDFSFPYPISGRDQEKARSHAKDVFFNNKWEKQKYPLSWLIEKFWPVPGWTEEDLKKLKENSFKFDDHSVMITKDILSGIIYQIPPVTKGIVFYTDHQINIKEAHAAQKNLNSIAKIKNIKILSTSIKKMSFGDKNIHFPSLVPGLPETSKKQILGGLENIDSEIVFITTNILYTPSYFDFVPKDKDVLYYNNSISQKKDVKEIPFFRICGYRQTLLKYFKGEEVKTEEW